jgi:hypothetical protein
MRIDINLKGREWTNQEGKDQFSISSKVGKLKKPA